MIVQCSYCGKDSKKRTGHVNRAIKMGLNIYCDKKCSGLGRRYNKTIEQLKEEKKAYDIQYRKKNLEVITKKKKAYYEANAKEIYLKQRAKRDNDDARNRHAEYCRQPEQRYKEKIRRYIRIYGKDWQDQTKFCVACEKSKHIFEFESYPVFPDGRRHICNECEEKQINVYGYSTKSTINAMVNRRYTNLTRHDVAKYPYLIEANKFLILLKKQLE